MSSSYRKNINHTTKSIIDWYKILHVSPSSTSNEIKIAYYKIAQQIHPDKHNGCIKKLEHFKRINEAYDILSNPIKRNEYDIQMGHHIRYGTNSSSSSSSYKRRAGTIPKDYRKVYTSRPPPEWKTVWDHAKHYDMHYGNGIQKEAIKQAMNTAMNDGSFTYQSSLGKGFTFNHLHDKTNTTTGTNNHHMNGDTNHKTSCGNTTNQMNFNPYSKHTVQGPPKIIFNYEEIVQNGSGNSGKRTILKQERIIYDLHLRRYERYRQQHEKNDNTSSFQQQQQQQTTTSDSTKNDMNNNNNNTDSTSQGGTTFPNGYGNRNNNKSSIYSKFDDRYQQSFTTSFTSSSQNIFSYFVSTTNNNNHQTKDEKGSSAGDDDDTTTSTTSSTTIEKTSNHSNERKNSCIIM